MTPRARARIAVGLAILVMVAAAAVAMTGASVEMWLMSLAGRIDALGGPVGFLLFAGLFVGCALVLIPSSALSLVAGLLYGPAGIAASWLCMMMAATLAFPLARHVLLDVVESAVESRPIPRSLMAVVAEEGWRMVLLVRVSGFIPFGLQNYALGVTQVGFVPYLLATSLGVLPSILVYASVGAVGQATLQTGRVSAPHIALLGLGIAASLTLVVITARKVRARLKTQPAEQISEQR